MNEPQGFSKSVRNPVAHLGKQPGEKLRIISNRATLVAPQGPCIGESRGSPGSREQILRQEMRPFLLASHSACSPQGPPLGEKSPCEWAYKVFEGERVCKDGNRKQRCLGGTCMCVRGGVGVACDRGRIFARLSFKGGGMGGQKCLCVYLCVYVCV